MPSETENNNGAPQTDTDETCVACHSYFDKTDECDGNYVPLTRDEEWILAQMREVKVKVASVKKRLKELEESAGFRPIHHDEAAKSGTEAQVQWLDQKQHLDVLRQEWQELNRRRPEAASFRMQI